jgi:hypothetical protein
MMMLLFLPACFAAGFCLGYLRLDREKFRTSPQLVPLALVCVVAALVVLFLAGTVQSIYGWLLAFAAVVTGCLAGLWYTDDQEDKRARDKLIFIAGAGGLLFLSALEYDHKLFGNLSKIGGSEFSVEFSDKDRHNTQDVRSVVGASNGYLGKVFPGNSGLKLAIGTLRDLQESIVLDDYYSVLFSYDTILDNYKLDNYQSDSMKYLYSYFFAKKSHHLRLNC